MKNIGHDESGTHCGASAVYEVNLAESPVIIGDVAVEVSEVGFKAFETFFRRIGQPTEVGVLRRAMSLAMRLFRRLKRFN